MSGTTVTIQPGEVVRVLGNEVKFLVTAEQTGGAMSLVEYLAPAGFAGPAPHVHETFEEIFYVLEGAPEFLLEGERLVGAPGTVVVIPRGKVHTFGNPGPAPARFLTANTPAGFELYFKELAALVSSLAGPHELAQKGDRLQALWAKYDSVPIA
jgi:quercetin dioxygenase-like cupin family protein